MPNTARTSGKAILSGMLGLSSLLLLALTGIPALILGLRALREVNRSDGALRGAGFAILGMALGALSSIACLVAVVAFALMSVRETAARVQCDNNLRRIGQVLNLYHETHGFYPAGTRPNALLPPEKRWSWQAAELIYVHDTRPKDVLMPPAWTTIVDQMQLDEAWDAEANRRAVAERVRGFVCPSHTSVPASGLPGITTYVGIAGIGADAATLPANDPNAGAFGFDRKLRRDDIIEGTSYRLMVVETDHSVGPWAAGGPATVRGVLPDDVPLIGYGRPWGGLHPGGANALMADGAAPFLSDTMSPELFGQLATIHRR